MKKLIVVSILLLILSGCTLKKEETKPKQDEVTNSPIEEVIITQGDSALVVASNLNIPWSITKHNDTFYITERNGNIVKIENEKVTRQQVKLEKRLSDAAEAGLMGFVLTPDFETSNKAFAYYTYEDSSGQFNRIVTLRFIDGVWEEVDVLVDKIPSGRVHHGGRLKIGPDGKLYATTGDALKSFIAQDLKSLGGKILRMNLDGSIPEDNPFPNSYVYSYGHRNPQGLAWTEDKTMYASEHGNSQNDEINRIEAGKNYGWPIIEGNQSRNDMETPIFTSGNETTWAPSGIAYYDGKLYVATLRGEALKVFDLETGKVRDVISDLGRIRDVLIEGDTLYFITNNTDGRGNPQQQDDKLYQIKINVLEKLF